MDSLQHLLKGRTPDKPVEMAIITQFVQTEYQAAVEVIVRERDIIISAPNAALINTLRLRSPEIKDICKTDKRLVFRIG